jgi:TonB-dependent starch-binding outer membrane protein SusC
MDKNSNLIPNSNVGLLKLSKFRKLSLTLSLVAFVALGALASTFKVSGTVVSATDKSPLPGVSIQEKGTKTGTSTGINGDFTLNVSSSNAILVFSYVGFETQEVALNGRSNLEVVLTDKSSTIDQVVVVGYGVQKKSVVTASISSVKAEQLSTVPAATADRAIQGRTAGVTVLPTSGSPGAGSKIRIRGTNSNRSSNPLYIVDGMKMSGIENVDPNDIASIEILKDAASAAIYGTEGANGVIIITTKIGAKGDGKLSYSYQYGIQSSRSKMDLMNAKQYTEWMQAAGEKVKLTGNANTNWIDETFETAPMQKHSLSFSGGNDKTAYMMSGSYYTQDGIVGGSSANYERITARINASTKIKSWLEVGNTFNYSHSNRKSIGEDDEYRGVLNNVLLFDPTVPVKYSKGGEPQFVKDLLAEGKLLLKDGNGNYYGMSPNVDGEVANPVGVIQTYKNKITNDNVLGTFYANIKPFEGFTFTSRFGVDLTFQTNHSWSPKYYVSSVRTNGSNIVTDNIDKFFNWLWENFASYDKTINDHHFNILMGYSAQRNQHPNYYLSSGSMVKEGDSYAYHSYTLSGGQGKVGGAFVDETQTSWFGRVNYDYKGKYLLEGSVRRDAASVFPTNDKSAVFPAFSVGWVVSNEDFAQSEYIHNLKLRASWGQNGSKSNLPGNEDRELWTFWGVQYPDGNGGNVTGGRIEKLTNPNLKWERTEQLDLGVDFTTLGGRLSLTADYYHKKTKDLIARQTGPLSVGNVYPFANVGDVTNKGFDFELGIRNISGAVRYNANFNLSTNDNEVTNLKVNTPVSGDQLRGYDLTWFEKGYPIWYFKGYKTNGIGADGKPKVVDVNKDGTINPSDLTYIGDPHPDFLMGANFNVAYKNFDLTMFLQGSFGNDIFTGWYRTDRTTSNKPAYFYDDWKSKSGPSPDNISDYIYRSDLMIQDGSYVRVKQLQLGYNLPIAALNKIYMNKVRVYVSIDDYFTFTKYKGLDPEAGSVNDNRLGIDRGVYPIPGKVIFGINVEF